jgi:hypothetical protein
MHGQLPAEHKVRYRYVYPCVCAAHCAHDHTVCPHKSPSAADAAPVELRGPYLAVGQLVVLVGALLVCKVPSNVAQLFFVVLHSFHLARIACSGVPAPCGAATALLLGSVASCCLGRYEACITPLTLEHLRHVVGQGTAVEAHSDNGSRQDTPVVDGHCLGHAVTGREHDTCGRPEAYRDMTA